MKRYEFMHLAFYNDSGVWDATPRADAVVAKLNELGAQGWHPSRYGAGFLQREIVEPDLKPGIISRSV